MLASLCRCCTQDHISYLPATDTTATRQQSDHTFPLHAAQPRSEEPSVDAGTGDKQRVRRESAPDCKWGCSDNLRGNGKDSFSETFTSEESAAQLRQNPPFLHKWGKDDNFLIPPYIRPSHPPFLHEVHSSKCSAKVIGTELSQLPSLLSINIQFFPRN